MNNKVNKKINSNKMMIKNQISTLSKMIIKTSKELEKYVNMTKRFNKIKKENLIYKNKEIKFLIK